MRRKVDAVDETAEGDRQPLRAVSRALDLLLALGGADGPLDLASLARRVGLHPTTTLRHLDTMLARGFVHQTESGYLLGARVFELGSAYIRGNSIWRDAREIAEQLALAANETASVGIMDRGEILYIAIAHGQNELGIQSSAGTRHPAHCTALGKAILSSHPWNEAVALLDGRSLTPLTEKTITDFGSLRDELLVTSLRGYSIDDEERAVGVLCIGAPIFDHTGRGVAAVSISGPKFRLQETGAPALAALVVRIARDASTRFGGRLDMAAALSGK